MSNDIPPRPNERLSIQYKGEDRELFMSYLRLNQCVRVLGSPQDLPTMMLDPDTIETMLAVALADGPLKDFELQHDDLTHEAVDAILQWVQDHLVYFFMKRFQQLVEHKQQLEPAAQALKSSLLGSGASTSSAAAAGPSI